MIVGQSKVYWGATGVDWFPLGYEWLNFIFKTSVQRLTRLRVDGMSVSKRGLDDIRPDYEEGFAFHGKSREFAMSHEHLFINKRDFCLKYPLLKEPSA